MMSLPASATIARQLSKLLPRGAAWLATPGSVMLAVLTATADELSRVYSRAAALLVESRPSTAVEMLADWESEWGSPGPCTSTADLTADERRQVLSSKVVAVGGQSAAYFIGLGAAMGITITISAGAVGFIAGVNRAGDVVGTGPGVFHWVVTAPSSTPSALRSALECQFNELRPAHTTVSFEYA